MAKRKQELTEQRAGEIAQLRFVSLSSFGPQRSEWFPVIYLWTNTGGDVQVMTVVSDAILAKYSLSPEEFEDKILRRLFIFPKWDSERRPKLWGGSTAFFGKLRLVRELPSAPGHETEEVDLR